ncbi:hypothetical protein P4645_15260 [Lysinibacillus fusiformis]|uniref:hypothetical protein n=1 Tax=Lysinibacillus fusiformis TaxID=28031 RepID=UPI002E1D5F06|nr:hypothetical protein [Lysinibacillus fusiformis]
MFQQGDVVEIVDDAYIAIGHPRLSKHYKNSMIATVLENFYGCISIQTKKNVSSILLVGEEINAIRKINFTVKENVQ